MTLDTRKAYEIRFKRRFAPRTRAHVVAQCEQPFRGVEITIDGDPALKIRDLLVGHRSNLPAKGIPVGTSLILMQAAAVGEWITFIVENTTDEPLLFNATVKGWTRGAP